MLDLDKRVGFLVAVSPAYRNKSDYLEILAQLLQVIIRELQHRNLRGTTLAVENVAILS